MIRDRPWAYPLSLELQLCIPDSSKKPLGNPQITSVNIFFNKLIDKLAEEC